ncbi:MAG: HAD family phosphatase [Clostridia bacterium]|nr:HAD family phosphatase [Clostridia bacterium]
MIKAVLFDMDGTVFDTEKIYYRSWVRAAEAVSFAGNMHDVMPLIFGVSETDIGQYFYENWGADFPYSRMLSLRASFIAEEIERDGVPLKDGVPNVFCALAERGVASALVSSAPRFRMDDFLTRTGLADSFSCIISGERVEKSKPAPDIFLLAAREMGLSPEECLVAEDSRNGVLAGYRAGMSVAMIPDLQPYDASLSPCVTYLLTSLSQLPDCIDS